MIKKIQTQYPVLFSVLSGFSLSCDWFQSAWVVLTLEDLKLAVKTVKKPSTDAMQLTREKQCFLSEA